MANFAEMRSKIPQTKFGYSIYKNIQKGKLTVTEKVVKDQLRYVEDKNLMDWKIEDETGECSGYEVQKAQTHFAGRDYTAWFSPEIPISDGPYKFNGLPGLIVEIHDKKENYVFRLTKFQGLKNPIPFQFNPENYLNASQKQFKNIKKEFYRNPYAALAKVGIKIMDGNDTHEKTGKISDNGSGELSNPIELE